MNAKVKRTLILLAVSAALFTISESYNTSWMNFVRGASAGFALAGIFSFFMIIGDVIRKPKA
jgi:hypothetical protein